MERARICVLGGSVDERWESRRWGNSLRGRGLDREGAAVLEEGVRDSHCPLCPKGASSAILGG